MRVDSNIYISKNDAIQLHEIINNKIKDNLDFIGNNGVFTSDFNVGLYNISLCLKSDEYLNQILNFSTTASDVSDFKFKKNENAKNNIICVAASFSPLNDTPPLKNTSLSFMYFCEDGDNEHYEKLLRLQFLGIALSNIISNNKSLELLKDYDDLYPKIGYDEFVKMLHKIFSKCDIKFDFSDSELTFILKIGGDVILDIQHRGVYTASYKEIGEMISDAFSHIFYKYDIFDDFRY